MEKMIEEGIKMGRIVSFATLKWTTQAIQKGSGSVRETKNEEDGSGIVVGQREWSRRHHRRHSQAKTQIVKSNLTMKHGIRGLRRKQCLWILRCCLQFTFDYVKKQIQKMQPDAEGKLPYSGSFDCAMKTLKAGGPFKFYTGFPVYCVRIAPHVMMTWIFLNQIQKAEKKIGL
ncbi:hypothetical protein T459_31876 [Capsicum annuum]|uniref:Mitochondrial dicarboxylate/tricarboxylate transporter DTC n=1 Tax=Capsicum annuum TaxID=4072 RepID=A0A2G2Y358_CAPAN|nr:hypothetical protein T459_31876 [Capsicum annuum]